MRKDRKTEHIHHSLSLYKEDSDPGFSDIHFMPVELPEINLGEIDIHTRVIGSIWNKPFYINAMTGGTENTGSINMNLAVIARSTSLPIAVGSQTLALADRSLEPFFSVIRKEYPNGFILANVSAATPFEMIVRAIDMLDANAVQIHLNLAQEIVMREGDRNFCGYMDNIANYCQAKQVPVILKGVGYGLSRETVELGIQMGVDAVDLSGRGGTSFVEVELARSSLSLATGLERWGLTTAESLLDTIAFKDRLDIFASGGLYNPYDAVKAISLGACAVGIATPVLSTMLNAGVDSAINYIHSYLNDFKKILGMLGCRDLPGLRSKNLLIRGQLREFCELRNIDPSIYAIRNG